MPVSMLVPNGESASIQPPRDAPGFSNTGRNEKKTHNRYVDEPLWGRKVEEVGLVLQTAVVVVCAVGAGKKSIS